MRNAEMIRYWNESAGPVWVANQDRLDAQIGPLGARVRERAAPAPGERALEVGCGCGATTLELAEAVGPNGRIVALDISEPMLAQARARAREADLAARIEWRCEDAQTARIPAGSFDLVFSRFGVMFFDDPVAAFTNLRRALRSDGRLAFVCWQARERNPWLLAPALAAAQHIPFPPPPPPDAPGPFAFGDGDRVRGILAAAGFARIDVEAVEGPLRLAGETAEEAVALFLEIGPLAAALREARPDPAQRARVIDAVRGVVERFRTPRGFEAPCGAWIVQARKP